MENEEGNSNEGGGTGSLLGAAGGSGGWINSLIGGISSIFTVAVTSGTEASSDNYVRDESIALGKWRIGHQNLPSLINLNQYSNAGIFIFVVIALLLTLFVTGIILKHRR